MIGREQQPWWEQCWRTQPDRFSCWRRAPPSPPPPPLRPPVLLQPWPRRQRCPQPGPPEAHLQRPGSATRAGGCRWPFWLSPEQGVRETAEGWIEAGSARRTNIAWLGCRLALAAARLAASGAGARQRCLLPLRALQRWAAPSQAQHWTAPPCHSPSRPPSHAQPADERHTRPPTAQRRPSQLHALSASAPDCKRVSSAAAYRGRAARKSNGGRGWSLGCMGAHGALRSGWLGAAAAIRSHRHAALKHQLRGAGHVDVVVAFTPLDVQRAAGQVDLRGREGGEGES